MLGWAIGPCSVSIRARRTWAPSGCSPRLISSSNRSDSSGGRSRNGDGVPGSVTVPRPARISASDWLST